MNAESAPEQIHHFLQVLLDDKEVRFLDHQPVYKNDTVYLPLRYMCRLLGAQVKWNFLTKTIRIQFQNRTIQLKNGQQEAVVNGESITMEHPPFLKTDQTMVPLAFFRDILALPNVEWMAMTDTVVINNKEPAKETYTYKKYTLPKTTTLYSVEFPQQDQDGVEFDAFLNIKEGIDEQYYELFTILNSKFGNEVAKDVVKYVRMKRDEWDELAAQVFQTQSSHRVFVESKRQDPLIWVSVLR